MSLAGLCVQSGAPSAVCASSMQTSSEKPMKARPTHQGSPCGKASAGRASLLRGNSRADIRLLCPCLLKERSGLKACEADVDSMFRRALEHLAEVVAAG